jgi:hypothetical protein
MGPDLADGSSYYGRVEPISGSTARSVDWRTPPLWGFADSAPYLHDGRVNTLEEAVALHGGEAMASTERFFKLLPTDRLKVQSFLRSLPAPGPEKKPPSEEAWERSEKGTEVKRGRSALVLNPAAGERTKNALRPPFPPPGMDRVKGGPVPGRRRLRPSHPRSTLDESGRSEKGTEAQRLRLVVGHFSPILLSSRSRPLS